MGESAAARRRVLIVEDDPLSARVAEKILERLGYSVCGVLGSGEAAVARAVELVPDVVLMDINLAGAMDGVAAAKAILQARSVPVIFLTATVGREIMDRVAASGAAGYIQKPVKLLDLKANLEMAIVRRLQERPCPALPETALGWAALAAVAKAVGRPLAVVDAASRVVFAYPQARLAGLSFAEAFPGEPSLPGPDDVAFHDADGQAAGWVRLLGAAQG